MKRADAQKLYELLVEFQEDTNSKVSNYNEDEYLDGVVGYISYCLADESSFESTEEAEEAKNEAEKWIED